MSADGKRTPIGVLGGTFDPVHLGHLRMATEARRLLGLARTLLVPAARPPHKPRAALSAAHHRLAMLQLAIEGLEGVEASAVELERPGIGYTIDTLRLLRRGRPPCDPVFILGMDALAQIDGWRSWRALIDEFDLAVVARAEDGRKTRLPPEVAARIVSGASLEPGGGGRIFLLAVEPIDVSSSVIRERARTGGELDDLVPPGVGRYIQRTGLYRQEERS